MKIDSEIPTFMIRDSMKIFLEDIEGHIKDAEESVKDDPEDYFHANMIRIFSAAKKEFEVLFAVYLGNNDELGEVKKQLLVDKLFRFAERYKTKERIDIIYKLVGEMLETRMSVIFDDKE